MLGQIWPLPRKCHVAARGSKRPSDVAVGKRSLYHSFANQQPDCFGVLRAGSGVMTFAAAVPCVHLQLL